MKKNLLDTACIETLVSRAQRIQPDDQPLWGTMTAAEMMLHCNRVNEQLLNNPSLKKGTKLKQLLGRWLVLYALPNYPKNARTPKRNDTKGQIDAAAFYNEQKRFVAMLRRFPQHDKPIELPHPYFGDLNTKQWGLAGYKHVDHHLRQFGV